MKQKDSELTSLREQYKHLLKLSRDKQLGEREKLAKKVEEMESIIEQQKNKIFVCFLIIFYGIMFMNP